MFRELTKEEEKEFRACIYEDEKVLEFLKYARLCHPVTRDEMCRALRGR